METALSIVTLLFALGCIGAEAGMGALRGMKKELCRIGSLFVIGMLLFFLVPGIAKTLILAVVGLIYPGGNSFSDIAGIIATELQLNAAVVSVIETILALTASLLVPFVFVVLFWVCKLISWPIFALVCLIIKNAGKPFPQTTEKAAVPEAAVALEDGVTKGDSVTVPSVRSMLVKEKPDSTERLIGAAIGAVAGLFLGALTFMPLAQLNKTVEIIGAEAIAEVTDEETAEIVCFWSESPAGTLYRVTQLESLFGLLHNSLARIKIEDRVYEAKSLTELAELIPEALELAEALEDMETGSLAAVATPLKTVVAGVLDVSLFNETEKTELVRYLAREGFAGTETENRVLTAMLNGLQEMEFTEVRNDVLAVIDLVVMLDRYGLTKTDDMAVLAETFGNETFVQETADAVYAINLAEAVLPAGIDWLLESVLEEFDVKVVPSDKIENFKETKEDFKELLRIIGLLANAEGLSGSIEKLGSLTEKVLLLKDSAFISDETFSALENAILGQVFTRDNIRSVVDEIVEQNLAEIRKSSKEEIDDETVEKTKEAVVEYLTENDDVTLVDLSKVITKMEDGSLMDKIDDSDVIEEIKNGSFDLKRWLED